MLMQPTVLTLSKRTADLCAVQALLYSAGMQMVTATNLAAARSVLNGIPVKAVIVCHDSWSEEEREAIISELTASYPKLRVILRCPGCTGCDEAAGHPGVLRERLPVTQLISTLSSPEKP